MTSGDFSTLWSLLVAPAYYLLPLGVGLLVCHRAAATLTRTQRLLLAYLVGLVAICAVFVARERARPADIPIDALSAAVLAACVAGFVLARRVFAWDAAMRRALTELGVVLPAFAVGYLLRFAVFSDFPLTDLFQATHLMKAALGFAFFDELNPFTADSYVPVLPVIEGLLVRYLGYEPLPGIWALAALAVLVKFLALRAVMQATLSDRTARLYAMAAAGALLSSAAPTNGDLVMLGALLLMSMGTHGGARGALGAGHFIAIGAGGLALGYAISRSTPLAFLVMLGLIAALGRFAKLPSAAQHGLGVALLAITLSPLHRSALAFVPIALVCGACLPTLRAYACAAAAPRRILALCVVGVTVFAATATIGILVWTLLHPADGMHEVGFSRWVVENVLRVGFLSNPDVLPGTGPKVALFEIGRTMGPAFAAAAAYAVVAAWLRFRDAVDTSASLCDALAAWLLGVLIVCAGLLGIPFLYRAAFFVIVLFAMALAAGTAAAGAAISARGMLWAAIAYLVGLSAFMAACGPLWPCRGADYLNLARPFLAALAMATVAIAIAASLFVRKEAALRALAAGTLVAVFAIELAVSKAYFMVYSYGPRDVKANSAVSHLSRAEIDLAAQIRAMGQGIVLISDPFTMSNLRALTGLNSIVSFSNLDTQSPRSAQSLRDWLRRIIHGESGCTGESAISMIRGSAHAPEFNYWLVRAANPRVSGHQILEMFDYRGTFVISPALDPRIARPQPAHAWHEAALAALGAEREFLVVIGRKTISWAEGREVSYFPDVRPLDAPVLRSLASACEVRVHDGRFALVRFPMALAR